jgi:methylenetetrahydrofolate dehydrogenase (NADP+)/methenyltetrahydrofolate cyclohydrolase
MSAKILDGKLLSQKIKDDLKKQTESLFKKYGQKPSLVAIAVGEDAGAQSYISSQQKCAEYIGIDFKLNRLKADVKEKELFDLIGKLNADKNVSGIMIHQPIPSQINYAKAINSVNVEKDVEGMNWTSLGKLIVEPNSIAPCTPASVIEHLRSTGVSLAGKEAVMIGRSEIVGKPLSMLLLNENLTLTICHSKTQNLEKQISRADVVVASIGKPKFIKGEWIKKGSIVIDVGINRVGDKIVGDVDFDQAKEKAAFITPVPGGVGPLTVVMLMRNCVNAFLNQLGGIR